MAFVPNYRSGNQTSGSGAAPFAGVDAGLRAYMLSVYNWMTAGLVVTGLVAYGVAETSLRGLFYATVQTASGAWGYRPTPLGMLVTFAPLAFVLVLSFGINRLSRPVVQGLFWALCATMGASLANILMVYTGVSVARAFFVSAATFGAMSLWGYTTRRSLASLGSFLMMGMIGLLIAMVVNIFMASSMMAFVVSVAGVLIFTLMTAYSTQAIRATYLQSVAYLGPDEVSKRSVYDALGLYLNFINLFTFILQFMGVRSNSND
ncbi:Bax inhibitor-1/YccA family protein [Brytella acorum]|uniref:Bax inhibitor-1/YccA family protein n=1 Tax=Brytella acorum TaxID=2959299 RepID=A0AA35XXA2_9PROT|nr:Bax inhibitor-1/YccA family protein [Brytella acorum]MDF3624330.1 Bax inhibitor-1/YccA family protein [Brytella acorum]CAI9121707.1 Bax inhibitor-1/YccA family protein [Brytella acorum]